MKILNCSLWKNSWIPTYTKFFESHGHEVRWILGEKCDWKVVSPLVDWADVVLCHWAVGWSILFSKIDIKKPLFVISRSFENFFDTAYSSQIHQNNWAKITKLFMLNESHFDVFTQKVKGVLPVFIKNGIDVDFWELDTEDKKKDSLIGWVANINHKKGEMLAAHAINELKKVNPLIQLHHCGKCQSDRIMLYLVNLAPYFATAWFTYDWIKDSKNMKKFYRDKKYILSCSMVEGHPMNILEAMATGCKPMIHRYPGVQHQFPDKYVWNTFDDLKRLYQEEYKPEEYREFIKDNYDYRKAYIPLLKAIENAV